MHQVPSRSANRPKKYFTTLQTVFKTQMQLCCTFNAHQICTTQMQLRFNLDSTQRQPRCNLDATLMQFGCNLYATYMQLRCNFYATWMQHRCNLDANQMQDAAQMHPRCICKYHSYNSGVQTCQTESAVFMQTHQFRFADIHHQHDDCRQRGLNESCTSPSLQIIFSNFTAPML